MLPLPAFSLPSRRLFAALVPALIWAFTILVLYEVYKVDGGYLTIPIYECHDLGAHIILVAIILCGWAPRVAGVVCIIGVICCVPICTYMISPGSYVWILTQEYADRPSPFFSIDPFGVIGCVTLLVAVRAAISTVFGKSLSWGVVPRK